MVDSRVVGSADDAVCAAATAGYPVVLKVASREIAHKNDAGLVAIGLTDAAALRQAFVRMEAQVQSLGLAPATTQFLLQPMLRSRAELIIGTICEAPLGHFLLAGLGGIHAELLDSVILLPMPMPRDDIRRRIADSPTGALIAKLERRPRADAAILDGVVDALAALQTLVLASNGLIRSIDVNPFLVNDTGCIAVDALIVPAAGT
jgi:hypothetical protein